MSYFSSKPEQSTSAEAALLTQLNNLDTSQSGFAIAKNADGTFSNVSISSASGANTALSNLASVAINTDLLLGASDGGALGSTSKMWSDLFVASGAVINFNAGNYTITHSAGLLTTNGALTLGGTLALAANSITMTGSIAATGARVTKIWATDIESTNMITIGGTSLSSVSQALTNKDLTSGTNTFPTFNQNTTGSAAKWTTARNLAGNSVDGSADATFANKFVVQGTADTGLSAAQFLGALSTGIVKNTTTTGVLSIAVAGDFPTLNQNTSGSAATLTTARSIYGNNFNGSADLAQIIASTFGGTGNGFTKFSGPTTSEKTKTVRDASDTILELGGSYTPTGTWTSLTMVTPVLGTPTSGTLTNCTGLPAASVVAGTLGSGTFTLTQLNYTNNAITASSNAATVPISSRLSTVTNNSAATLTITMTTTSAVNGQMIVVRILDFSAAAQTIAWVNTEDSTVTAPTTSNGSTTLPLTVGFIYNSGTSKWRCVAKA